MELIRDKWYFLTFGKNEYRAQYKGYIVCKNEMNHVFAFNYESMDGKTEYANAITMNDAMVEMSIEEIQE